VSGQLHAPAALPPERAPGTHFLGAWVDSRAGLDDMEKWKFFTPPGLELPLPLVVQPVASRYTDWTIIKHKSFLNFVSNIFRCGVFVTKKQNKKIAVFFLGVLLKANVFAYIVG
jgi:hypothetical protein